MEEETRHARNVTEAAIAKATIASNRMESNVALLVAQAKATTT